jgi:hypothetical protein
MSFLAGVLFMAAALGVASGALAAFYAGTQQVVSAVATGAAPFVVSSNTTVANLNVDLLGGFNSTQLTNNPGNWTCTSRNATSSCTTPGCSVTADVNCSSGEQVFNGGGKNAGDIGDSFTSFRIEGNGYQVSMQDGNNNADTYDLRVVSYAYCCS